MKTHELKLIDRFVDAVDSGRKNFEVRKNDREFQTGDLINFKVVNDNGTHLNIYWEFEMKTYEITYILSGWGIENGYVVLGIKEKND